MCFDVLAPSGRGIGIWEPGGLVDRWGLKPPTDFAGCLVLHVFCVLGASCRGRYGECLYINVFLQDI